MFSYQLQTSCQFLAQTDQKLCNLNEVNSNANFYSLRLRLWKRNPTYVPLIILIMEASDQKLFDLVIYVKI